MIEFQTHAEVWEKRRELANHIKEKAEIGYAVSAMLAYDTMKLLGVITPEIEADWQREMESTNVFVNNVSN